MRCPVCGANAPRALGPVSSGDDRLGRVVGYHASPGRARCYVIGLEVEEAAGIALILAVEPGLPGRAHP